MKKLFIKVWNYIYLEYKYRKKLRQMRKRDPFIYK